MEKVVSINISSNNSAQINVVDSMETRSKTNSGTPKKNPDFVSWNSLGSSLVKRKSSAITEEGVIKRTTTLAETVLSASSSIDVLEDFKKLARQTYMMKKGAFIATVKDLHSLEPGQRILLEREALEVVDRVKKSTLKYFDVVITATNTLAIQNKKVDKTEGLFKLEQRKFLIDDNATLRKKVTHDLEGDYKRQLVRSIGSEEDKNILLEEMCKVQKANIDRHVEILDIARDMAQITEKFKRSSTSELEEHLLRAPVTPPRSDTSLIDPSSAQKWQGSLKENSPVKQGNQFADVFSSPGDLEK